MPPLNWEDNPPINGFYEMMMSLTPERRGGTAPTKRPAAGNPGTAGTAGGTPPTEAPKDRRKQAAGTPRTGSLFDTSENPEEEEPGKETPQIREVDMKPRPFEGGGRPYFRARGHSSRTDKTGSATCGLNPCNPCSPAGTHARTTDESLHVYRDTPMPITTFITTRRKR